MRRRAEWLYQQLDILLDLRREARRELLTESQKHPAHQLLRQIPRLGPIRVALIIALLQTPHRFRTKRQLWNYCGLGLRTRSSGEYRNTGGQRICWPAGLNPPMARLSLARKIAAIALKIWKKGERFDPGQLKRKCA